MTQAIEKAISRPCGNPECACSSFISDQITFGSGELDELGWWEFPCKVCAAHFEARDRADGLDKMYPGWFPYLPRCGSDQTNSSARTEREH